MDKREQEPDREHTRVVIVDDHYMVRTGITLALLAVDDIELVGEAADGEAALRVCDEVNPDVVIMDLKLPRMDGVRAIRELRVRHPEIRVLALTTFPDETLVEEALQAGACGYLLKDVEMNTLLEAIYVTRRGLPTIPPLAS
jgi:DNA-binding NarL/FixJ family response regulator